MSYFAASKACCDRSRSASSWYRHFPFLGRSRFAQSRKSRCPEGARSAAIVEQLESRVLLAAVNWTGLGDGTSWSNAANWDREGIAATPQNGDDVTIADLANTSIVSFQSTVALNSLLSHEKLRITSGMLDATGTGEFRLNAGLQFNGGTLTGSDDVLVGGSLNWTRGTMSGSGRTVIDAAADVLLHGVGSLDFKYLDRTLVNHGTAVWAEAILNSSGGHWDNRDGATLELRSEGGTWRAGLTNAGTVVVDTTISYVDGVLDNSGTIRVAQGVLELRVGAGSVNKGAIELNGGNLLVTSPLALDAGTTVTGTGVFEVRSDLAVNSDVTIGNLKLGHVIPNGTSTQHFAGTIEGSGTLTVAGHLDWRLGTMAGTGMTIAAGSMTISDESWQNQRSYLRRRLENRGHTTITSDAFTLGEANAQVDATFVNAAGATLTLVGAGHVLAQGTGRLLLDNRGLLEHTGTGTGIVQASLDNSGTIEIRGGTIVARGGGRMAGSVQGGTIHLESGYGFVTGVRVVPGATLIVSSGWRLDGPAGVAGHGKLVLQNSGTSGSPHLFEVMSRDVGATTAGFETIFTLGTLTLSGSFLRLVDTTTSTDPEALYVNTLVVPSGSTLDLNGLRVYARVMQLGGTLVNGTVERIPDSGPITLDVPTAGTISSVGEVDEWTFYGRAGRSVTVVANPSASGPLAPPLPTLSYAHVRILDPLGNVLAEQSNVAAGQTITLRGIELSTDGTYRVQVLAEAGHAANVGNYMLTVWNATVDHFNLVPNDRSVGTLNSPFSVDRWTFTASANDQVRFDLINRSSNAVRFRLTGPDGWTAFNDLTANSGLVTLPSAGEYVLDAYTDLSAGGNYSFKLEAIPQVDLPLGTIYTGTLLGTGHAQLFRVEVPTSKQLRFVLDAVSADSRTEVYAKFGAPPTRGDYDYRAATAGSADQELVIPSAMSGTWYVLVYGSSVPATSSYTLNAAASDVFLTDATPDRHGNSVETVMTLTGAGFRRGTTLALVAADGTRFAPHKLTVDTWTQMTATFAAGLPTGIYDIVATDDRGDFSVLADSFSVTAAGAGTRFDASVIVPQSVGATQPATLYVRYANLGDVAMAAPLLTLRATDGAKLTLDSTMLARGVWSRGKPDGFNDTIEIYASGATPGVLQPGEEVRIPVYFAGLTRQEGGAVSFGLESIGADDDRLIDWVSMKDTLRPPGVGGDAWDAIFANLADGVGTTWGDYIGMLSDNAAYLGRLGQRIVDVGQLWNFEVQQAIGFAPVGRLGATVDLALDAPGLALSIGRSFSNSIIGRNESGPFGRGWSLSGGWDRQLSVEGDGTVVVQGADGAQRRFQPDLRGGFFSQTGDQASLTFHGDGYLLREQSGLKSRFRADGRLDYIEDTNGNRITAAFVSGRLARLTHSSGAFLSIAYNANGLIDAITDSVGRSATYRYDAGGEHLLSITGIDGETTTYTFDTGTNAARRHALLSITLPGGTQELYTYDARGRLASTANCGCSESDERITYSYDTGMISATDLAGGRSEIYFDARGLVAKQVDPLGRAVLYRFDDLRNLTEVVDAAGQSYRYGYDRSGNVTSVRDALGNTIRLTYTGPFGRLGSVTDARGNAIRYSYDDAGNLITTTYADGSVEEFDYDPTGNLVASTDRRGQAFAYTTDDAGRLKSKTYEDGSTVAYEYDARGNLVETVDAHGTTTLEYDDDDRLEKITYPTGRYLAYSYDAAGRRTRMVDQDGFTTNYAYDAQGRLQTLTDATGAMIAHYTYDTVGRLFQKDLGNGTFTTYDYDLAGQLLHLVNHSPSGAVTSRFDYGYDSLGRRTSMATLEGTWTYSYDAIGQLTRAEFVSLDPSGVPNQDLIYEYDAAGNRVRTDENGVVTEYETNSLNQYTKVGDEELRYDAAGNLVTRINGNEVTRYDYDADGRLASVMSPAGTWEFAYDAFGNRVATVKDGVRTEYLVDPEGLGDVVAEYSPGGLSASYTLGLGLTSRTDAAGTAYYDSDALGSTVGLTDASGALVGTAAYLPFGGMIATAGAGVGMYGFVGGAGVAAEGNGLSSMRARFYDARLSRFLSADPIGIAGRDVNLYRYAGNNPANEIDPSGHNSIILYQSIIWSSILGTFAWQRGGAVAGSPAGQRIIGAAESIVPGTPSIAKGFNGSLGRFAGKVWRPIWEALNQPAPDWLVDALYPSLRSPHRSMLSLPDGKELGEWLTAIFVSRDPNQKLGPGGYGDVNYATPAAFQYRIDFENEAKATAPAQRVTVSDRLSTDLDWDSLEFTGVGFGDLFLAIPPGLQHFETTLSMTFNGQQFDVEIELSLQLDTGEVYAVFQSIDPSTELPPDVLTGFLPPEDGTGRGEGFFTYLIRPEAGLPTGTEIRNVATIIFDEGEVIDTNQVDPHDPSKGTDPLKEALVTLDIGGPTSAVLPLSETSGSDFEVRWTGEDDLGGSGIGSFDIYVAADVGPFTLWLDNTTATSAIFTGTHGVTYRFYSVATDNVGHTESAPETADAVTTVFVASPLTIEAGDDQVVTEGDLVQLTGASFLFGGDVAELSGTIDWGDGTIDPVDLVAGNDGGTFRNSHRYADDGSYVITIVLHDASEASASGSLQIITINALPVISITGVPNTSAEGAPIALGSLVTDPGTADTHSYNWSVTRNGANYSLPNGTVTDGLSFSFTPAADGVYVVTLAVIDDDNGLMTTTAEIMVTEGSPLAAVQEVIINGGSSQRSNVETISLRFDRDFDAQNLIDTGEIDDLISLWQSGISALQLTLSSDRFRWDATAFTLTIDMTIDGFGGSTQTMLSDGRFRLSLDAGVDELFADTDGLDDGLFGFDFHRLEGDYTGDGSVDALDQATWLDPLVVKIGARRGQAGYDAIYDLDGDGVISSRDYYYFSRQLAGHSV